MVEPQTIIGTMLQMSEIESIPYVSMQFIYGIMKNVSGTMTIIYRIDWHGG